MAFEGVFSIGSQYLYEGKGPFDAKMLVDTFDELINADSWTVNVEGTPTIVAYRGMIVAVRKNSDTYPDARGVYFFNDGKTKKPVTAEEVANISAWNKLCSISELEAFASTLTSISETIDSLSNRVDALEKTDTTHSYGYRSGFPTNGELNHLYIANDQRRTYVYTTEGYLPIADQFETDDHDNDPDTPKVRIIFGGSAED